MVGRWLRSNGESIYGAGPSPFGAEFGTYNPDTTKKDSRGNRLFDAKTEWRCTTKPGKLFIHFFKWPSGLFELSDVKGKVSKAYMLTDPARASISVKQTGDRVTVTLPELTPDKYDTVMVLELAAS